MEKFYSLCFKICYCLREALKWNDRECISYARHVIVSHSFWFSWTQSSKNLEGPVRKLSQNCCLILESHTTHWAKDMGKWFVSELQMTDNLDFLKIFFLYLIMQLVTQLTVYVLSYMNISQDLIAINLYEND